MAQAVVGESRVERIGADKLGFYWPHIAQQLDLVPQFWEPWWTKEWLRESIESGGVMLLGVGSKEKIEVMLFIQVARFPAGDILQCFLMIGNNLEENIRSIAGTLELLGRDTGCHLVEIIGRKGWARKLKGWRPCYELTQLGFQIDITRVQ